MGKLLSCQALYDIKKKNVIMLLHTHSASLLLKLDKLYFFKEQNLNGGNIIHLVVDTVYIHKETKRRDSQKQ